MRLYIKQKIFSISDKYNVYDEQGNLFYDVDSKLLTIGAKIHLKDLNGKELYYIKQRITFFLGRYEIYKDDILCATVQQGLTFLKPRLTIESKYGNFEINGDIFSMDYDILQNGSIIGSVNKKWLSWSDTYEMNIPNSFDSAFFSAIVIAIDNCLHNDNN